MVRPEGKVVFIEGMKAKIGAAGRENGVHKEDESQNWLGRKENGVHRGNESQNWFGRKGKWCS
ncbi:hypothetical protein M1D49_17330 [Bacillus sp. PK3-056]|uniref:hypothetical protein n=1 Tax=Niallia circulans TaxID=1397 RepID=UPI000F45E89B|nr:hypothetical protein [Niallia circulans]AYV71440.1 hypothetical protein C2H98_07475 [Niallia circulans]